MNGRIRAIMGDLEWITNRYHVATRDDDVVQDIERRMAGMTWNTRERSRIIRIALAMHHRNQRTYIEIMHGGI